MLERWDAAATEATGPGFVCFVVIFVYFQSTELIWAFFVTPQVSIDEITVFYTPQVRTLAAFLRLPLPVWWTSTCART